MEAREREKEEVKEKEMEEEEEDGGKEIGSIGCVNVCRGQGSSSLQMTCFGVEARWVKDSH